MARSRRPISEKQFVEQIVREGGDSTAAARIWNRLKDGIYNSDFTPYPSDRFDSVFGILEEELDEDLVFALFNELGVPLPSREFLAQFGAVDTPLRLAQLIAASRAY